MCILYVCMYVMQFLFFIFIFLSRLQYCIVLVIVYDISKRVGVGLIGILYVCTYIFRFPSCWLESCIFMYACIKKLFPPPLSLSLSHATCSLQPCISSTCKQSAQLYPSSGSSQAGPVQKKEPRDQPRGFTPLGEGEGGREALHFFFFLIHGERGVG